MSVPFAALVVVALTGGPSRPWRAAVPRRCPAISLPALVSTTVHGCVGIPNFNTELCAKASENLSSGKDFRASGEQFQKDRGSSSTACKDG